MRDEKQRFSLRKLSVGLVSVLIGITFTQVGQTVHADTVSDSNSNNAAIERTNNKVVQAENVDTVNTKVVNASNEQFQNDVKSSETVKQPTKAQSAPQVQNGAKQTVQTNNKINVETKPTVALSQDTQGSSSTKTEKASNKFQTVTTTNLDINKQKLALYSRALSESKVLANDLPAFGSRSLDERAQGTKHTRIGDTRLSDDQLKHLAISSDIKLTPYQDVDHPYNDGKIADLDIAHSTSVGFTGTATLDKDDVKKGNKILIGTIQITNDRYGQDAVKSHSGWDNTRELTYVNQSYTHSMPVTFQGQNLGSLSFDSHDSSELDLFFNVTQDLNSAINPTISFNNIFALDTNGAMDYPVFRGITKNDVYTQRFDTGQHKYDVSYKYADSNLWNVTLTSDYSTGTFGDVGSWRQCWPSDNFRTKLFNADSNGIIQFPNETLKDNGEYDLAIKVQSANGQNPPTINGGAHFFVRNYLPGYISPDGRLVMATIAGFDDSNQLWWDQPTWYTVLGNNLSAKDVLDKTQKGQATVSVQNDGSIILGLKLTKDNLFNFATPHAQQLIRSEFDKLGYTNIIDPQHRDEIINNSLKYYQSHPYTPIFNIVFTFGNDASKPVTWTYSDVTPDNYSPYVSSKRLATHTSSDGANSGSFNAELYRNANVQYLDDDDNEKQVSADTLIGRKDLPTDYTLNIPGGFKLGKNNNGANYVWSADKKKVTYTFQDDQKLNDANPIVIHLIHDKQLANGGTKDLSVTRHRTIHYVYDNGTQAQPDKVQTVTFTRTAIEDMVNHSLSDFGNWAADGDYSQVNAPIIHGYTPTQNIVEEQNADPNHDVAITVTYNKNRQNIHVTYTDDTTGQVLDSVEKSGYSGDDSHYTTQDTIAEYVKRGYVLVSDDYPKGDVKFDSDDFTDNQDYHVHLKHDTTDHNLEHTVTRTIHYVYANGQTAKPDYAVPIKFTGVQTTDNVTGQVISTKWTPASQTFAEIASPLINGYTADRALLADVEVNPNSDNIVQTVTYNPNKQNIHVVFIDDTTGNTLNRVEKSGYTSTDSGYSTKNDIDLLVAKGYKLVSDDSPKNYPTLHFDSDDFTDDQNFTVHVKHDTKENNLIREVTRTIHYVYVGGKPAGQDKVDSITFNGTETIDKVDGHVISTIWTPKSKEFASVTTPSLQGYTPDKFSVDSSTIKPDSDNSVITVTYSPDTQYAKFNYIDDTTGNQLKQETSHGETGNRDNYSTANLISYFKNKGYDLVSDDTANKVLTFDNDDNTDQVYNIHFSHGVITIDPQNPGKPSEKINPQDPASPVYPDGSDNLTSKVDREIDYVYEDGRTAKPSVKDSITFNNTEKIDKVTGEIISSTWDGPKDFTEIQTPVIEGYTPSQSSVENKAVTHTTSPIKVVVKYSADPQHMTVIYRDLTDNRVLSQMTKDGVSDEDSHYNTKSAIDGYLADGYLLSKDGTNGKDLIFDHNDQLDQTYYVDFTHGSHQYNPEKPDAKDKVDKNDYLADYTTTINYADNSGKALYSNKVVSDEYKRDLTIDSVTGNIIKRGDWTLNKGYTLVENPVITGYITAAKSVTPVDKQENQVINVVYNALGKVHSVDNKGKEIAKVFSYTNDPSDPTKVLVTKVPSVTGYEQVVFSVDPTKEPTKDTTVIFNAPATVTINYVDSVTGKTVHTDTVKGFATHTSDYTTQNEIGNLVKQGYVLAKDNVPSSIKLTEDPQNYSVILVHGISKVTHDKPITPDTPISNTNQKMPKGVDKDDLNREITRTITVIDPHTGQHVTKQVAKLFRDATVDNVTGAVTYTDWNNATWDEFTTPIVAGYTPSQNNVPVETVTPETKNSAITITYVANPQTGKISYVDTDGKEVTNTPLTGKTDEKVKVTPVIPHGWVVVDGQTIPDQVVATPNGIPTVSIKIKHGTIEVTPDKPKTPNDKMPDGDQYPDGVTQDDLNREITRTINVANPYTGLHTTVQTAHLSRNAVVDLVTKAITYGKWSTATWDEFNAPTVAGYTPSIKSVAKTPVDISTKNTVIDITYTANPQTGKISYVDNEGKEVAKTDLHGKTDEDVQVKYVIPHGWVIVDGQDIPTSVKATADGIPTVTIKIKHGILQVTPDKPHNPDEKMPDGDNYPKGVGHDDLNKDVTRQIILHEPNGDKTVSQVAKYTRIATIDLVTGRVTYSDWNTKHGWDEYTPEAVTGYTTSIKKLAQVDKPDKDTKVEINYTAIPSNDNWNGEPVQPSVPNQPEKPVEPAQPTDNNKPAEPTKKTQKRNKNKRKNKQVKRNDTKRQIQNTAVQTGYKRAGKMIANSSKHGNQLNRDTNNGVAVNTSNKVSANAALNSNDTDSINPNNATTLPQTGEKRGTTEALAGILLASMGIATAIGAKNRKKRE